MSGWDWNEEKAAPKPAPAPTGIARSELAASWSDKLMATPREGDLVAQARALVASGADAGVDVETLQRAVLGWIAYCGDYDRDDVAATYAAVSVAIKAHKTSLEGTRVRFPHVIQKGQRKGLPVASSLANVRALLDAYRADARYNLMTHRLEIDTPAITCAPERRANHEITWWRQKCHAHGLNRDAAVEYLSLVSREHHPVRDWIASLSWDGVDRVSTLIDTIDTDDELAPILIRRWLLQCVAAVVEPKFRPTGVLVLQGPQGCGKTTWLSRLCPQDRDDWIATGMHLDPTNRDDVQAVTRYWITELGELDATFRRADVAALKAFVDRRVDVYRSAYARREEETPRRTVLCASVNRSDFLADDTGNRRWWTVRVRSCHWQHGIDLGQLWAQLMQLHMSGESYRLAPDELAELNAQNVQNERVDPLALDLWDAWEVVTEAAAARRSMRTVREIVDALPQAHASGSNYVATSREVAKKLRSAGAIESRAGKAKQLRFGVNKRSELAKRGEVVGLY